MIDIILPTIPARKESLDRCVRSLLETTTDEVNLMIQYDSQTCGGGWKKGLEDSKADYVLLACDDQEFIAKGWDRVARRTVDEGLIPCPRVWTPDSRIESQGGDMNAFRHIIQRPQRDRTLVDYCTIPFLSREMADKIGMLDVHYASDTWVSHRGRQLGYQTILRHGFEVRHWQEQAGRGAGMGQNERDAIDCETVRKELERCASSLQAA